MGSRDSEFKCHPTWVLPYSAGCEDIPEVPSEGTPPGLPVALECREKMGTVRPTPVTGGNMTGVHDQVCRMRALTVTTCHPRNHGLMTVTKRIIEDEMTVSSFPMLCCAGPRDKEMASLGSLPPGAPSQSQGTGQTCAGARARPGSPEKPGGGASPSLGISPTLLRAGGICAEF